MNGDDLRGHLVLELVLAVAEYSDYVGHLDSGHSRVVARSDAPNLLPEHSPADAQRRVIRAAVNASARIRSSDELAGDDVHAEAALHAPIRT